MADFFSAVTQFLADRFGGTVREEEAAITVGTTIVLAAARDPERVSLTFVNLGATTLFLAPSTQPSSTFGIRLGPAGGTLALNVVDDANLTTLEWNSVGSAAAGSLYRLSVRRDVVSV